MIYFIRHGESVGNTQGIIQGSLDFGLTRKGEVQAKLLSDKFKNIKINYLFSSPLKRALKTTEILNNITKLDVQVDDALQEYNYGIAEGKPWQVATNEYGIQLGAWSFGDVKNEEGPEKFCGRVDKFIDNLRINFLDKDIVCITHGAVISRIVCNLLGMNINARPRIRISNTSVMEVDNSSKNFLKKFIIVSINDCGHLV